MLRQIGKIPAASSIEGGAPFLAVVLEISAASLDPILLDMGPSRLYWNSPKIPKFSEIFGFVLSQFSLKNACFGLKIPENYRD
mgnify:CR=1 FL=1